MDEEKPGASLRVKEEPEHDSVSTKAEGCPEPENVKPEELKIEPTQESCEEEEEEEDALAPAEIKAKRESHAPQVDLNLLHKEPDFAMVCSFFNKFGSMMGMKPLSFTKLESLLTSFEPDGHVNKELMDIHLMLMRRIRMLSVRAENWENYLKKFLALNDVTEGELFQVERYGYVNLPVSSKIQILKALCDAQFDYNVRLRESMATACRANNLRLIPLGMDKNGLVYWFQQDVDLNIRIYTEEPDDHSGVTWTLAVSTPEQLDELIEKLKSEDLGYVKKEFDGKEKKDLNADPEAQMPMSTKKGTFVDLHLDEAAIKRMREFLTKQKEERKNKREGKSQKAESEKEEEVEEEQVEEDLDKRVMPRRSAASKAVSNIRKFATPSRKTGARKKKTAEGGGEEEGKESGAEEKDGEEKKESSGGSSDEEDEDEEEGEFSDEESEEDDDDEFKPKTDKPKRKRRKRGPKTQKKKALVDEEEDEDDSDEEEVKKERKVATGDSACGQCKKSGDWDVLLLCDVCDDAWHTYCLKPVLWFVPDGDWFCPKCVHGMLIEKLEEVARVLGENLKKRCHEDKKKKAAADRLRREMEYIGVSLNNIIPVTFKPTAIPSSSSSDEDITQRKSKRKAVKKIAPRSRFQMEVIQTIAEGRSRRRTQQVDYNFKDYDEAIQDACAELGQKSRSHSPTGEIVRPTGGAGRGKDMANILEAEEKRRASVDENTAEGDEERAERLTGKPVKIKLPKHRRKLNDLNPDDEDSDSEEYQANESDVEAAEEDEVLSGSDYVPSGDERRMRSGRTRSGRNGPTQSDEDFVVSDSDGSFGYRSNKQKKKKEKAKKKKKGRRWESSEESEEESEESEQYYSDDSEEEKRKKKRRSQPVKWKAADSDEEEQEDEEELEGVEEGSDSDAPKTEAGRPMRRTVAKSAKLEESDESEQEDMTVKKFNQRPVGALDRIRQKKGSDSEGEFKPDEEEEEEEEEDEEEEELPEAMRKKGVKRKIESSDDEEEEQVDDSKRLAPPPKLLKKSPTIPAPPTKSTASKTAPSTTSTDVQPPCKPISEDASAKEEKPFSKTAVNENGTGQGPTANGSALGRPSSATNLVKVKEELGSEQHTKSPGDVKPLTIQPISTSAQSQQSTPVQKQMTVPPATYAGSMPPGPYSPHPGYYQGAPSGMPPYSRAPPPGQPYQPYGGPPPTSHWQSGPYVPPPRVPNPYAPVHNPYAQPPAPPTSASNSFNDLQSL